MTLTFDDLRPLAHGLPPIVMLSAIDGPGAGGAMLDLHTGLTAAGARVTTLVLTQTKHRSGVVEIERGPNLKKVYSIMAGVRMRQYPDRLLYFELFSLDKSPVELALLTPVKEAELIHLHWIAGMVGFPQSGSVLSGKRVVWTLHDMNPITGGCHYTAGCGKYASGCEACPQLGESVGGADVAAQNFADRRAGYATIDMTAVSPGTWQSACVGKSKLLGSVPHIKIPHCVDAGVFAPQPVAWARASLGLPLDRKVIAFGAASLVRWNKGLQFLKLALESLRPQWRGALPVLLVFGYGDGREALPPEYECFSFKLLNQADLAKAYSAADVFVSASLQETFGLVTAEAQACGTPGIGFHGTGAEDIIEDGVTGYLAAHPGLPITEDGRLRNLNEFLNPKSVDDLAVKIKIMLELPDEQVATMRARCRERALREYAPPLQAGRYLRLYRRILGLPEITIRELPE